MMGMDCINQQTAQDRDCSHCIWHTDGRCASWDCEYISRKEALEALEKVKAMESAQPEIIHCRDCKHRGEKPIADGRYWCEIHDTFMYYCSDAERRTDEQT